MFVDFVFQKTIKNIKHLKNEINIRERKFIIRNVFFKYVVFFVSKHSKRNNLSCNFLFDFCNFFSYKKIYLYTNEFRKLRI